MTPTELVEEWVRRFNRADIDGLTALYAPDAVNHQVVTEPLRGRPAIREMFETEFGRAKMTCIQEQLFACDDWAILEWRDPLGLRGCGFFLVRDEQIVFQRGYFDQLSFFKLQGIPKPNSYLEPRRAARIVSQSFGGECLCGQIRYRVEGRPRAMFLCHCSRCRRETGTAHGANVFFDTAELVWERGEDKLRSFELAGTRKARAFCAVCGSPMPRREGATGVVLPAGSLDVDTSLEPTAHIHVASRASWEDELADLKRYEGLPT